MTDKEREALENLAKVEAWIVVLCKKRYYIFNNMLATSSISIDDLISNAKSYVYHHLLNYDSDRSKLTHYVSFIVYKACNVLYDELGGPVRLKRQQRIIDGKRCNYYSKICYSVRPDVMLNAHGEEQDCWDLFAKTEPKKDDINLDINRFLQIAEKKYISKKNLIQDMNAKKHFSMWRDYHSFVNKKGNYVGRTEIMQKKYKQSRESIRMGIIKVETFLKKEVKLLDKLDYDLNAYANYQS